MTPDATPLPVSLPRRAALASAGALAAGLALGAHAPAAAQNLPTAGHPLVGTWFLVNTPANPTNAFTTFSLHADGTYVEANPDGPVRLGAWEATGPTTATLTITAYTRDATGASQGGLIIRLNLTLNPDGKSYHALGTIERINPDGSTSGQAGPATGEARRMAVEAPGPPVMTLDQLFGGAPSTPATTPAP